MKKLYNKRLNGEIWMDLPQIGISYNTSENDIDKEFYFPCFQWATRYDRGVGFFTSGWISRNCRGLSCFIGRGGISRWITSPILEERDYKAILAAGDDFEYSTYYNELINKNIDALAKELEKNTLNAFAWMIFDHKLLIKFAIPIKKLEDGDFHDKFGIFYGPCDEKISFVGSINDSKKGFVNYESIKVFKSWDGMMPYIQLDVERFERLWKNLDSNIKVYKIDEAIKTKIICLRNAPRPYELPLEKKYVLDKWAHQDEAMNIFIDKRHGILEMATGSGKTYTTVKIIRKLLEVNAINKVIIIAYGNDLLLQWEKVISREFGGVPLYRYYGPDFKELPGFLLNRKGGILLLSRDADRIDECFSKIRRRNSECYAKTFLVFDEVHGLGSSKLRLKLSEKIRMFEYRLGLSATPERGYDIEGNKFIKEEIGEVIFRFGLKEAIQKGILCEFSYEPFEYKLTEKERNKKKQIIAGYEAKKKRGEIVSDEELYRDLAMVNKTSEAKLPIFEQIVSRNPELLKRCIIFVETKQYGDKVQKILIRYMHRFHTYYGEDDKKTLKMFGQGDLDSLITCKKISEGVDIKSVNNIILFSSDRSQLVTTQRIGRSLRLNPDEPGKRARIIDFICVKDSKEVDEVIVVDEQRMVWLEDLAKVKRGD